MSLSRCIWQYALVVCKYSGVCLGKGFRGNSSSWGKDLETTPVLELKGQARNKAFGFRDIANLHFEEGMFANKIISLLNRLRWEKIAFLFLSNRFPFLIPVPHLRITQRCSAGGLESCGAHLEPPTPPPAPGTASTIKMRCTDDERKTRIWPIGASRLEKRTSFSNFVTILSYIPSTLNQAQKFKQKYTCIDPAIHCLGLVII